MKAKLLTRRLRASRNRRFYNATGKRWINTASAARGGWMLRYCRGHGVLFLQLGDDYDPR